mgnify:CR=1 FL=1
MHTLRPYQAEVGRAVLDSVLHRRGLTFSVEMARQGGKNELSAQLELLLLVLNAARGGDLVKAAPTFVPQVLISLHRLRERIRDARLEGACRMEAGHILRLGRARQVFLSADTSAHIVGTTAHLLLEVDEAQEVDKEKFYKDLRPMGAAANVTTVLYGTPWDGHSLLEEVAEANRDAQRRDGIQRHFRFDWEAVASYNPLYRQDVEAERLRLADDHPLFRTQYLLLPVVDGNNLFTPAQKALLQGTHPRLPGPLPGRTYVAGLDVGGQAFTLDQKDHDFTVLTIGELDLSHPLAPGRPGGEGQGDPFSPGPTIRVVEVYCWRGEPLHTLAPQVANLLGRTWRVRRAVVDATGVGAGLAGLLQKALGGVLHPFLFTRQSKSSLGYDLLAAASGRLSLFAPHGSPECQELWREIDLAQAVYRPDRTMDFFVDPQRGHDDFLVSLALLVKAAEYLPRVARGQPPD